MASARTYAPIASSQRPIAARDVPHRLYAGAALADAARSGVAVEVTPESIFEATPASIGALVAARRRSGRGFGDVHVRRRPKASDDPMEMTAEQLQAATAAAAPPG